jgi:hypothetical protein
MKKLLIILVFLLAMSYTFTVKVHAEDQFAVDAEVTYKVSESGKTHVTHDIVLENITSSYYATTYTLTLENIDSQSISAFDHDNNSIPKEILEKDQKIEVKLTFSNAVVGKNTKRHFFISYDNASFAVKTGEIWEVSIPKLSENESFRNYEIKLEVPDSFGQEAYISPQGFKILKENGVIIYTFSKDHLKETGVNAGFGQFQVFSFNLAYHLENPLAVSSQTEIALPPDTAFQKVYFTKVDPKPSDVRIDADGNYIAKYKLNARQRIDVVAEGSVQIFAGYRSFPKASQKQIQNNLAATTYWQATDPQIKELAAKLKTPDKIYEYVAGTLKYDLGRVQPNVSRMGALASLKNPTQAICMEFTDLFIAIARAAGIPAREINGYAYTENRQLQPLSLVADVLHSWPEYYDKKVEQWIPIDPTWGSTSGVDYFNKLDLRHFTFVVHGESDKEPYPPGSYKLGPNPQKDVFVTFSKLPELRNSIPHITVSVIRNIPFMDIIYGIKVVNPGPTSLYALYPTVYFDNTLHARSLIPILPPFASYSTKINTPYNILGKNMPDTLRVVANEGELKVSTNKAQVVVNSLVLLFAVLIFIVILVLFKLKKLNFLGNTGTMRGFYEKIIGKFRKNIPSAGSGPTL